MNLNKIYEIGMLINPDLSQQEAEGVVEKVEKILTKKSASVISKGEIVKIDLAYQIITKIASKNERFDEANFTWVKFEEDASKIDSIKKEIDKIKKEVFRYLIVKTVKDDSETDKFKLVVDDDEEEDDIDDEILDEVENGEIEVEEIIDGDDNNAEEKKEEEKTGILSKIKKVISGDDDLTKIEGIGPKTAEALATINIKTFEDLADSKVGDLRDLLSENPRLSKFDPKTWSKQARLARDGKWDELKTLQDELDGGEVKK